MHTLGVRWVLPAAAMLSMWACGVAPDEVSDKVVDTDAVAPVEGTVTYRPLRRLNRSEYGRTVRDLLGVSGELAADFPVDDASHGFDTVAEGLTVSPLLVELYEHAASVAVSQLLDEPLAGPIDVRLEGEGDAFTNDAEYQGNTPVAAGLYSAGTLSGDIQIPEDGLYRVSARVWGDQAGPDPLFMALRLGVENAQEFTVDAGSEAEAVWISAETQVRAGRHLLQVSWLNDYWTATEDRNAFVDAVRIEGPLNFTPRANPAWNKVMTCDPKDVDDPRACVVSILSSLVPKAWRRPLQPGELDDLMAIYDEVVAQEDPAIWGLEFALRAVLTSPHFVFLVEPEATGEGRIPLDDYALAARMSYALWSTMPDSTLRDLAEAGTLHTPKVLREQVHRMLMDERAMALAEDFAGQWLMIRALADAQPDFYSYPSFTEDLRAAMKHSMELQFSDLVFDGAPMSDLVLSRTAWLDNQLAALYGLRGVHPDGFERIDVGDYGRRGWLTTAGLLTATSYPTRTSPVRRGVWVLSQLLCDEPEPPPPGVEGFPEPDANAKTVRERLEAHRVNPSCSSCHKSIDPIGLAFEGFTGIGIERSYDAGEPVDTTGVLPDGTEVDGIIDLAEALSVDERFARCVTEKFYTYAQGRAPSEADAPFFDAIHQQYQRDGGTFEALATAVFTSDVFRTQEVAP